MLKICSLHISAEVVQSVPAPVLKQTSWSSFEENTTQNQSAETLLKALKNVQQSMYTVEVIFFTVLPAKNGSDVMFCLHSYQGLIIDRSLVY